jgi:glutathione S-transferase
VIKLYGTAMSRSGRALWTLEELGVNYEHIPVEVKKAKSPEVLRLNPNGHIPTLDDSGLVVRESMAINLYLAEKYGKAPFWPANAGATCSALSVELLGHAGDRTAYGDDPAQPDASATGAARR